MRAWTTALLAGIVFAAGCEPAPTGPELAVSYDPAQFDEVNLRWTRPGHGEVTEFAIEVRAGFGPWERRGTASVEWPYARMVLDSRYRELEETTFRVRALPDDEGSRASNEVAIRRGVRAPEVACASALGFFSCPVPSTGVRLLWLANSTVADRYVVERTTRQPTGESSTTVLAEGPFTTYLDTDTSAWVDGVVFVYAVYALAGGERSVPAIRATDHASPSAPDSLSAVAVSGGIRITFRNVSRAADRIRIERRRADGSFNTIALFAAPDAMTSASHDDLGISPGSYEYAVSAETFFSTRSPRVFVTGVY